MALDARTLTALQELSSSESDANGRMYLSKAVEKAKEENIGVMLSYLRLALLFAVSTKEKIEMLHTEIAQSLAHDRRSDDENFTILRA